MVVTSIIVGVVLGNQFANRWVTSKSSGNGKRLRQGIALGGYLRVSLVVRKVPRWDSTETSPALYLHHLATQASVNLMIAV